MKKLCAGGGSFSPAGDPLPQRETSLIWKKNFLKISSGTTYTFMDSGLLMKMYILTQGSEGIRQWPKNLYMSQLMIHKINPSIDLN